MFISHFNRYFEKHAKLTYFVLLVIIIATFVIFVTPGSMRGGNGGLKDFGKIYGKKLSLDLVQKEMAKTTIALWIQQPQFFGMDFSSQKEALFGEMLNRMRILHYAKQQKLDNVSDGEVIDRIQKIALVQDEKGTFNKTAFDRLIDHVKNSLGLLPADFDQVVRETIVIDRVIEQVRSSVTVADSEIDDLLAQYTLKCATVGIAVKDAIPTEEEIQNFFATRKDEIKLPASKNAAAAIFRYDEVRKAMGAEAVPTADEIAQRYEANKNTVYKDQTLEQVSETIGKVLSSERVRARARKNAQTLYADYQSVVQDETAEARLARFKAQAEKLGGSIVATGVVALDNVINGMGEQPRLADAVRNVSEVGGVSSLVVTENYAAVAMVTTSQPTQMPEALPALKTAPAGADPLRAIIIDAITREKAMAFFQTKVKEPYDKFMATVDAIQANKSMSQDQRQQALFAAQSAIDTRLTLRFYVQERRSFAQVTFAPEGYADKVQAPTEEEIAASFEARNTEFEGKTLADVRETVLSDLKAARARELADQAADAFAAELSTAWWNAKEANPEVSAAAMMEEKAAAIPQAKYEVIEGMDPSRANAANSEVLATVYQANLTSPISGSGIRGLEAAYVTCLTGIEKGHLADPAKSDETYAMLVQAYRETTEMNAAQQRAQEESKRVAAALKENGGDLAAAAGDLVFADLPAFSVNDIASQSAVVNSIQSSKQIVLAECADELAAVKTAGVLLTPQRAEQVFSLGQNSMQSFVIPVGYQLLYVAARTVPEKLDSNAAERQKIHDAILARKQSQELQGFFQTLVEQSQTELRPGTPYTGAVEEE